MRPFSLIPSILLAAIMCIVPSAFSQDSEHIVSFKDLAQIEITPRVHLPHIDVQVIGFDSTLYKGRLSSGRMGRWNQTHTLRFEVASYQQSAFYNSCIIFLNTLRAAPPNSNLSVQLILDRLLENSDIFHVKGCTIHPAAG